MKIAQIVPIWFPVPPEKFGGLELIAGNLISSLRSRGHEVTVYGFSQDEYMNIKPGIKNAPLAVDWLKYKNIELDNYVKSIIDSEKYDLLHFHISTDLFPLMMSKFSKIPCLITLHNYSKNNFDNYIFDMYPNNIVTPSMYMMKNISDKNNLSTVYHGINYQEYYYQEEKDNYFVYLSRVERKKGIMDAIRVSKKTKSKLVILGPVPPYEKKYFEDIIRPEIDDDNVKYLGEADLQMKNKYLSSAQALIFPTKYEETFGLVAAESMACGTPVIAYDSGAVPEIVKNNETGYVVEKNNEDDLVKSAQKIINLGDKNRKIISQECQKRVKKLFSIDNMTSGYISVYEKLINN